MALQLECEKCGESYSEVELIWIDSENGLMCEHCVNLLIEELRGNQA